MPKNSQKIIWITRSEPSKLALVEPLTQLGCSFELLSYPKDSDLSAVSQWLRERLSSDTQVLFVEGKDLQWLDTVCSEVRKAKDLSLRFLPIFWAYEKFDEKVIERVSSIGVDEIFSFQADSKELLARIRIRSSQSLVLQRLQKQIDEALKRSAATETAVKQREEFLSVCTHDLRSPIGIIQSTLNMALEGQPGQSLTPFAKELLTRAQRQSGNALRLVNDLLDVMSYEQGLQPTYELLNLDEFLKEFHKDYKSLAQEKGIEFHYENPVPRWLVLADADRVRQLLQNLLANAVKFTENGKNIFLTVTSFVGRRRLDPPYPMIVISFKDEGKGIPQKEVEKIFDRFSQIKDYSRAGGRGLGLSVAKQISQLHAGNLWVESQEGKGSTFNVLLPHVVSRTDIRGASQAREQKKILVVEPCEHKRKKNFQKLADVGFHVDFVKDGVEAVAMAFFSLPDAVILRHDMHKIGEAEVAKILKKHEFTSKIGLFVGLEEGESPAKVEVDEAQLIAMLRLPLDVESFQKQLSDHLQKHANIKLAA